MDPDEIPDRVRRDPCPYWEYFEDQMGFALFQESYEILNDVAVSTIQGNRIQFSDEHITVPLMAITKGGLQFPIHKILREILHLFKLTPC